MPNLNAWAGDTFPLGEWSDDYAAGVDTARLIADKPTTISVIRNGVVQLPQTVRIEAERGERQVQTAGGVTRQAHVRVLGYRGHPTIVDTSLQPGDRFVVAGVMYEVFMLAPGMVNGVQAFAEVKA